MPNDPGKAPVAVSGVERLLLETAYFGGATWALWASGCERWALAFGLIVLAHYLVSYELVLWMIKI